MSNEIVSHEEVLYSIANTFSGAALPAEVADDLAVSVSTARRRFNDLVVRGWLVRYRTSVPSGYTVTPEGWAALAAGVGW